MISPSLSVTSLITALSRSSNSPLNFAPAINKPISRDTITLDLRFSGTSPETILCANPSTMAVLPTPGSPKRMGLFLVLLAKICSNLLISSSRPITGSILPFKANALRLIEYRSNTRYLDSACISWTFCPPLSSTIAAKMLFWAKPESLSN